MYFIQIIKRQGFFEVSGRKKVILLSFNTSIKYVDSTLFLQEIYLHGTIKLVHYCYYLLAVAGSGLLITLVLMWKETMYVSMVSCL